MKASLVIMMQKCPIDHQTFAVIDVAKKFCNEYIQKKEYLKMYYCWSFLAALDKSFKYFNGLTLFVPTPWL